MVVPKDGIQPERRKKQKEKDPEWKNRKVIKKNNYPLKMKLEP